MTQKTIGLVVNPTVIASRFVFPCFVSGCHAYGLKIATAALRPRNDTKNDRFGRKSYHYFLSLRTPVLRFVFPCFASGLHTFNFKIATAALRPRNDTKNGRLYEKAYHFLNWSILVRRGATPQRAPMGHGFTQTNVCTSPAQADFTRALPALHFYSVPEGHRNGASSEAPFHAGVCPHFTCAAYFTCSKSKFHCNKKATGSVGGFLSYKNAGVVLADDSRFFVQREAYLPMFI